MLLQQQPEGNPRSSLVEGSGQSTSPSGSTSDTETPKQLDLTRKQDSSQNHGNIRIRATHYKTTRCEGYCSCRCHQAYALQTPGVVKRFFGSLFVGYNGIPSLTPRCNEKNCRKQLTPTVRISYYFPGWLLNRMLQFALSGRFADDPRISLSMPQVVTDNSEVFVCAVQGNLDGMRSLFEQGAASPLDVGVGTGRTALHVSILRNSYYIQALISLNSMQSTMIMWS